MTPALETRRFKDLLALRRPDGSIIGFHNRNLQVARLSEAGWQALDPQNPDSPSEAFAEIQEWESSVDPRTKKERRENGIRSLTVNVTQICNLHCTYCAAGGDGSYGDPVKRIVVKDTLPTLQTFIEKVSAGERFRITFLGGEPLLYPEGIRILAEESRRMGEARGVKIDFTIVTNGTLFTQANIELLRRFGMDITVSLDGPAQINDTRRPDRGGHGVTAKIEEGLRRLLKDKSGFDKILLSGVFGRGNLDLMRAFHYYRQFDADWFDFTYDHHEATPEINQQFTQGLLEVAAVAYQHEGEKGLRRVHTFDRIFELLDRQQQVENYCGAGKSFLMLDARQNLYTCPWVVGENPEKVGFAGRLLPELLQDYQDPLIEKHGCQSCWARYMCGGGCMYIHRQVTGDKHKVDGNYCDRTRTLIGAALSYYEQSRAL